MIRCAVTPAPLLLVVAMLGSACALNRRCALQTAF